MHLEIDLTSLLPLKFILCFNVFSQVLGIRRDPSILKINAVPHNSELLEEETELQKIPSVLTNFNEVIAPFSQQGCFIHLTSFLVPVDFQKAPNFPMLLRQVTSQRVQVDFVRSNNRIQTEKLLWMMSSYRVPITENFSIPNCFNSSHISRGEVLRNYPGICVKLNFLNFVQQSKQWTCEVYLTWHPPSFSFKIRIQNSRYLPYPSAWYYKDMIMVPSSNTIS